jgi:DNA invertase Pin-like site-specific DNA recombinase
MKTVAAYARISTEEQNTDGQTAELQKWLDRSGIAPDAVEWFIDKQSGKTLNRDGFKRMQARIAAGEIKTVVAYKLDRLTRSLRDGINLLADWTERGIRVVSVTQQIDVSGVLGQTLAAVLLGFAQIELEYRAERQAAGIREARKRGAYKGRKAGTLKAKPDRARELRGRGLQIEEIATALGVSVRSVHRYLDAA